MSLKLAYEQEFSNVSQVVVTHNLGLEYLGVQVIVDGLKSVEAMDRVEVDPADPTNKFTVYLQSALTGRVQVFTTGLIWVTIPTCTERAGISETTEFGRNFVSEGDGAVLVTTSSEWQTQASKTITIEGSQSHEYRIGWFYFWNSTSLTGKFQARLIEDDTTVLAEHKETSNNIAGDFDNTGSGEKKSKCGFIYRTLSPGQHTFKLQASRESSSGQVWKASMWDSRIEVWRTS